PVGERREHRRDPLGHPSGGHPASMAEPGGAMGHPFEITQTIEVDATAEEAWDAIATGPGQDSWFMGRNTVEPREGGTATFSIGDFTQTSTVTTWEPPARFAFSSDEGVVGASH